MTYRFDRDYGKDIRERICSLSNVDLHSLEYDFTNQSTIPALEDFKASLLSLKEERFLIVGDYDCDGICSVSICKLLLDKLGIRSNYYIPSRSKEGYGLNMKIVDTAIENGFGVLLMVDNGIVADAELRKAREHGISTLIIDHHEYSAEPACDSYLHPNLLPEGYEDMCAGGLSCLLALSFFDDDIFRVYGGLASLADMVRVFGYNRYLMKEMMAILESKDIHPISLLLGKKELSYENLSFNVIPKINAVSRLDEYYNVNNVVKYLLSSREECLPYLKNIETINRKRQELTRRCSELSLSMIDESKKIIVVRSKEFPEGICGLICNRLLNRCGKPVIVLSEKDGLLKGSGRAPGSFNLYGYLEGAKELMSAFGGHAQAVGLTLDEGNYAALLDYIDAHDVEYEESFRDVLLLKREDLGERTYELIEELRPFGNGFSEPLLGLEGCKGEKGILMAGKYPRFIINDETSAISFDSANIGKEFTTMIGHLKKDGYRQGKYALMIEELI